MGVLSRTPAPIDCDRPASADFLRVLAAWAVGVFHIWQQSWYSRPAAEHWLRAGSVGVDFLVVLSAFCLFLPWANAAAQCELAFDLEPENGRIAMTAASCHYFAGQMDAAKAWPAELSKKLPD